MNKLDIIRAWKDELFRKNLSEEEQRLLPEHPAGAVELTTEEMDLVVGGRTGIVACVTTVMPGFAQGE